MLDKTSWGNAAWDFFHSVSYAYPESPSDQHKQAIRNLVHSLEYLLPCGWCALHWKELLVTHPLTDADIESRESLVTWFFDSHNLVNARLNKPLFTRLQSDLKYGAPAPQQPQSSAHHHSLQPPVWLYWALAILFVLLLVAALVTARKRIP